MLRRALTGGLAALFAALPAAGQPAGSAVHDCIIDPSRRLELASPTGGIISEILVDEGARVSAGDAVARLQSTVEEASVELLKVQAADTSAIDAERSRLAFMEARLARQESLAARGVVTAESLEEIRAEVVTSESLLARAEMARRIAEQELVRARAVLARLEIQSPISGLVTRHALDAGEYLHPEAHVVEIVQLDPLRVEAFLPAAAWGRVAVGDVVEMSLASPLGETRTATISLVDQVLDSASGTFGIRATLPNPDLGIPAGHRCSLLLPLSDGG